MRAGAGPGGGGACWGRACPGLAHHWPPARGAGRGLWGRGRLGLTPVGRPFVGRGQVGEEPAGRRLAPHWPPVCGPRPRRPWRASRETPPGVQRSPWSPRSGLISAGSWWPIRARAPRPNSMAIVRRPLCSGGGHFLRGWAGAGRQETLRAEAQTPRPPWALGRGLRARPGAKLVSSQLFPLGLRVPVCRVNGRARTVAPGEG